MIRHIFYVFLMLTLTLLNGCGTAELPGLPDLYPVTLTVMQDGSPLAKAAVLVINSDAGVRFHAGGQTDANGQISLRTEGRYPGLPLGTYIITVSKNEAPDIALPSTANTDEEIAAYDKAAAVIAENTFIVVDPKFSATATSPLRLEVKKGKNNMILDVSPKVKQKPPQEKPAHY